MEGNLNLSAGNMIPSPYGVLDLHGSMRLHHQQHPHVMAHPTTRDIFLQSVGNMNKHDPLPLIVDCNNKGERKTCTSDDDEPSFTEDGVVDGHNEVGKGKKAFSWQRMKWTDGMVRLLITIVSYLGEDAVPEFSSGCTGRRKSAILQKKGKWKSVSKVMAERGCYVSPQQCEDKFNDLNKRYKRLTDLLGRGTSCKIVENPALLDLMSHLSEKAKEDVRKILSSKHLFYEEMCSYNNGNRIHLPTDPALQRSLQLALQSKDENEATGPGQDDVGEDEQEAETDDMDDEAEDNSTFHGDDAGMLGMVGFTKRVKVGEELEDAGHVDPLFSHDCNKTGHPRTISVDPGHVFPEGSKHGWSQRQWMRTRSLQLEEQKLQIEVEMLKLEKQRLEWRRFSRKKDKELDKLRMENERMKLENEGMALELKRVELDSEHN